jgi:hypothetical protein
MKTTSKNEELGLTFEKSICLLYNIDYNGEFNYSLDKAHKIKDKLIKLKNIFPGDLKHTAQKQNRYDFEKVDDNTIIHLSAKTTKKKMEKFVHKL